MAFDVSKTAICDHALCGKHSIPATRTLCESNVCFSTPQVGHLGVSGFIGRGFAGV